MTGYKGIRDKFIYISVSAWNNTMDQTLKFVWYQLNPKLRIKELDDQFCTTPADNLRRWRQYFQAILSTSSIFSEDKINSFSSCAVQDELACATFLQKARDVLSLIAVGLVAIVATFPEIIKICDVETLINLVQLFNILSLNS